MQSGNTWGQLQPLPQNLPSHSLCEFILPIDLDASWLKLVVKKDQAQVQSVLVQLLVKY